MLKTVLLDISGTGCRVFTNDRRVRNMDDQVLIGKTFDIDFDFYGVETAGISGKVVNVHPGKDPRNERQLGLEFTKIGSVARRDINRRVTRDREASKERRSPER
jgi:c-di-GMP-binding flagellar brake protein YcgR